MGIRQIYSTKHLENNFTLMNNYFAFNTSLNFQLPRLFSLEIIGFYFSKQLYGISYNKCMENVSTALEKEININNKHYIEKVICN